MAREAGQLPPVMALTLDGVPGLDHAAQARALCAAGARWIQFRTKAGDPAARLAQARAVVAACHDGGALCVVNDSAELAVGSGADGAHLGAGDGDWREARDVLGPWRILGGTVNDLAGAARAREAACLDYAGIGPLRFTSTKRGLAPVLGLAGIAALAAELSPLPCWAIGGVLPADLPGLRGAGAAGVAVSSALFAGVDGRADAGPAIASALGAFLAAWGRPESLPS